MNNAAVTPAAGSAGYTRFQITALVTLRMLIGWHLFYEGLAKITNEYWTSAGYLSESKFILSDVFLLIAANPTSLLVVDFVNKWGLVVLGLALLLGCLTRAATIAGIVLLGLYYIAAPPFVGYVYSMPAEGSYLIVNKVLIELAALVVLLAFPTGKIIGLDRLWSWKKGTSEMAALAEGVQ
jgi:thiosulfate dehydrogenase [quinone] large subunit